MTLVITCDHINIPAPPEWIYEGRYYSYWQNLQLLWRVGLPTTKHAFESAAGQKLLKSSSGSMQFDLVISEQFHQEAMLLFAHKFNAPLVTISEYIQGELGKNGVKNCLDSLADKIEILPRKRKPTITSSIAHRYLRSHRVLGSLERLSTVPGSSPAHPAPIHGTDDVQ